MTATLRHRQRSWKVVTGMRRAVSTLRYVNDELMRANEAIFRPAGAPLPSTPAGTSVGSPAAVSGSAEAATQHTGRAA